MLSSRSIALLLVLGGAWAEFQGQLESDPKPDPGQKTFKGCTCKSYCGPDATDAFNCDFCRTEGNCGRAGWGGSWDYCVYPPNNAFEMKDWQSKHAYWWKQLTADTRRESKYPNVLGITTESIQTSFDNWKDEMPSGRKKYIHTIGSVCQFQLTITSDSPYTGLLGPGAQHGFIRMGSAADYSNGGLTPGLGFKFGRSDQLSAGFVALHSLDLGQSWNFFKYNQSNHISPPEGATKALALKFNQASQCAPQVGLSDLARYSQDGTEHNPPKFPFKLFLVPSAEVQTPDKEKTPDEVHAEMAAFQVGTTLYTVYACDRAMGDEMKPTDGGLEAACGSPLKLGDVVTTSQCTTSAYGDKKFQIRHQRVEEDWELRPDFLKQYDAKKACGWSGKSVSPSGVPKKCSAEGCKVASEAEVVV